MPENQAKTQLNVAFEKVKISQLQTIHTATPREHVSAQRIPVGRNLA